jgi:hypothetical protein
MPSFRSAFLLLLVSGLVVASFCEADIIRIDYPAQKEGYRPVGMIDVADGFLLAGEILDTATGWDLSLLWLSPEYKSREHKTISGNQTDSLRKISKIDDGFFLLCSTSSRQGDLQVNYGIQDVNLIRLDANGEIVWSRVSGGNGLNQAQDLFVDDTNKTITTLSYVNSGGGTIPRTYGGWDIAVARYDFSGDLKWTTILGGNQDDLMGSLYCEKDRIYVLYNTWNQKRKWDMHLDELDDTGRILRKHRYGTRGSELAARITRLKSGDFILLATTDTEEDSYGVARGETDIIFLRSNERGKILLRARFGGSETELAHDIAVDKNDICWILGMTQSNDGDIAKHLGGSDILMLKVTGQGFLLDSQTFGTYDDDYPVQVFIAVGHCSALAATRVSENLYTPFLIRPELKGDEK